MSITIIDDSPTLVEQLQFLIELDKSQTEKHDALLREMGVKLYPLEAEDTLKVSYQLTVAYFGRVERQLRTILAILADTSVVVSTSVDELNRGESLIVSVIDRLREVQGIIKARQQA